MCTKYYYYSLHFLLSARYFYFIFLLYILLFTFLSFYISSHFTRIFSTFFFLFFIHFAFLSLFGSWAMVFVCIVRCILLQSASGERSIVQGENEIKCEWYSLSLGFVELLLLLASVAITISLLLLLLLPFLSLLFCWLFTLAKCRITLQNCFWAKIKWKKNNNKKVE